MIPIMYFSLFKKFHEKKYGKTSGPLGYSRLAKDIEKKAKQKKAKCSTFLDEENHILVAAFVTPLMRRTHLHIQQSRELTFLDATANCDV